MLRSAYVRLLAAAVLVAPFATTAQAQAFPSSPIKLVVGYPPGGGTDTTARTVARKMAESLGQAVVVENRPGATGIIAGQFVAKSPADGYTLLMMTANDTVLPALNAKLPFDLVKDFTPVSLMTVGPMVMVVSPTLPAQNVKDLIALGKTHQLNFGSSGIGGTPHLAGELFGSIAGIKMLHVPYKGASEMLPAVMSGQIDFCFTSITSAVSLMAAGKLKAVAVSSKARVPELAAVPTLDESGMSGYDYSSWYGVVGPVGMPRPVLAVLQEHIAKAVAHPEVAESLKKQGFQPRASTSAQFGSLIEREIAQSAILAKQAGLQAQ